MVAGFGGKCGGSGGREVEDGRAFGHGVDAELAGMLSDEVKYYAEYVLDNERVEVDDE